MDNLFDISSSSNVNNNEVKPNQKENNKFELFSKILESKNNNLNNNNLPNLPKEISKTLDANINSSKLEELTTFLKSIGINIDNTNTNISTNNETPLENIELSNELSDISNELSDILNNSKLENINTQNIKNNLILLTQNDNSNYKLEDFNKDLKVLSKIDDILNNKDSKIMNIRNTLENILKNKDLNLKEITIDTYEVDDLDLDILNEKLKNISSEFINELKNVKKQNLNSNIDTISSKYLFEQKIVNDKPKTILNVFSLVKNISEKQNPIENNSTNKIDLKNLLSNFKDELKNTINKDKMLDIIQKSDLIKNELKNDIKNLTNNLINSKSIKDTNELENISKQINSSSNLSPKDLKEFILELKNILKTNKIDKNELENIKSTLNNLQQVVEIDKKINNFKNNILENDKTKNNTTIRTNSNTTNDDNTNNLNQNINKNELISTENINKKSSIDTNNSIFEEYSFFNVEEDTTINIENLLDTTIENIDEKLNKNIEINNLKLKIVQSQVDQKDFINKIVDLIERKGKLPLTTLRIKLEPFSLGHLDIVLKSSKTEQLQNNINIQIKASKIETLNLIENNKQLLRSQIEGKIAKNNVQVVNVIYDNKVEEENKKSSKK